MRAKATSAARSAVPAKPGRPARASGTARRASTGRRKAVTTAAPKRRLKGTERREQILGKAADFFAEFGLAAQTRAIADACGVSQRLLYRVFPSKAALLAAVYEREIVGPFRAEWLGRLGDRSRTVEERLTAFYDDYTASVLTRRWLRLFLHASLADADMAPAYIADIVTRMLQTIVAEAAREQGLPLPRDRSRIHEIGWTLHGAISHLAIRREVYGHRNAPPVAEVVRLHVRSFLGGLPAVLATGGPAVSVLPPVAGKRTSVRRRTS